MCLFYYNILISRASSRYIPSLQFCVCAVILREEKDLISYSTYFIFDSVTLVSKYYFENNVFLYLLPAVVGRKSQYLVQIRTLSWLKKW